MKQQATQPQTIQDAIQDAIEWALQHGFALKTTPESATHCAFSFAPTLIAKERFEHLKQVAPLTGKLIHAVAENHDFLQEVMAPIAGADPFFTSLLTLHRHIHFSDKPALRQPLLFMRHGLYG